MREQREQASSARFNTMNLPVCAKALADGPLPTLPNCSVKQVWARAIANGAPRAAVANVSYTPGYGRWHVRIGDSTTSLADDC